MNNTIKLLYSLLIGAVATGIAKLVHPSWSINSLLIFGLIVFAVTFILTLLLKRRGEQKAKKKMTYKTERQLRACIGIAFWGGMGLMSLINALQLTNGSPIRYGWAMFGISIIFMIMGIIILIKRKRDKRG
jgi:tellurite resistance protein TehA-like permease